MKGYTTVSALMLVHMDAYKGSDEMWIMPLSRLCVRMPGEGIVNLDATPHYQYTLGNKQPYRDWLVKHHHLYESSLASFEHLMNDESYYLDEPYDQDFILCDKNFVIIDGVHRATRLFQLGVVLAPVALRRSHE
ncbi:MAG: hypothetical protein ACXABY_02095 [Candidatus Thorarchaeota archaeon]|jgi:hypothetical protein